MADFDPEKITKLMVERTNNYANVETQAKELAAMTGLDMDVAKAFFTGLTSRGAAKKSDIRGYKKEAPRKRGS